MKGNNNHSAIILFDGSCNFCNATVNFIIDRDPERKFKFAALQSDAGKRLSNKYGIDASKMESIVLVYKERVYLESTAALLIAKELSGLYPVLYVFIFVPQLIRNFIYRFFAKNRYKWFGKKESCMVPSEEVKSRFIF